VSSQTSTTVGVVVAILIVGAIATLGYYQFEVAGKQTTTSSTSTAASVTCPSAACVNVTIVTGASTTPPGFSPDTVRVVIGVNNTVFWTNGDGSGTPHTITPKTASAGWPSGSGILDQGDTYQWTFTVTGTYNYYCTLHPAVMSGTVIVVAGSGSGSTTSST